MPFCPGAEVGLQDRIVIVTVGHMDVRETVLVLAGKITGTDAITALRASDRADGVDVMPGGLVERAHRSRGWSAARSRDAVGNQQSRQSKGAEEEGTNPPQPRVALSALGEKWHEDERADVHHRHDWHVTSP